MENPTRLSVFDRQRHLYDIAKNRPVYVVGCGSLGSYIAFGLAKLGLKEFVLYDDDVVELHNLPNQLYCIDDLGANKALALNTYVDAGFPEDEGTRVQVETRKWDLLTDRFPANALIINAPDSMSVRKDVYEAAPNGAFIIDVRSGGDSFNIYGCEKGNAEDERMYSQYFFDQAEAAEVSCHARSVAYTSITIAGLAVNLFVQYANDKQYPRQILGDLGNFDLFCTYPKVEAKTA